MPDPFAIAAAALFRAPGSAAALYTPAGGDPIATRAIVSGGDADTRFGASTIVQDDDRILLPRADIPSPRSGDRLVVTDPVDGTPTAFTLYGDPVLDPERTSWRCAVMAA